MNTPPLPQFIGAVEIRPSFVPRPNITHVVFDFDGTLSWVRHGWPELMFAVFRKYLPPVPGEPEADTQTLLDGIVFGMNGRPSVVQMQRFSEVVRERGGPTLDAMELREEFQDQLDKDIAERLALIRSGEAPPDAFVVHAARPLLERLRDDGLTLVILSSTVEHRVKEEAEALGLTEFFGRHIYGSPVNPIGYLKKDVFNRLLREDGVMGTNLLSFGDGPVEIVATKEIGGLAIAVCSDEHHNGSGIMDAYKRRQLLEAGADAATPDFRDAIALVDYLRSK